MFLTEESSPSELDESDGSLSGAPPATFDAAPHAAMLDGGRRLSLILACG